MRGAIHRGPSDCRTKAAVRPAAEAGVTLVEVSIYAVLISILLVAAMGIVFVSHESRDQASRIMDADVAVRAVLRRMHDELIGAGKNGEDVNGNGLLDSGEDVNGNGKLEADWAVSASKITFNRILPDGTWSGPITYEFVNGSLIRTARDALTGTESKVNLAHGVTEFTVSESQGEVLVTLGIEKWDSPGRTFSETRTMRVIMRN